MPVRATKRGAERTRFAAGARRPDLRRLVRGARGGARAARDAARACWCSTATRSASGRPPRARPRPSWLRNLGLERRSGRRSPRCSCTRRARPRAGRCRGRSRRSTTARCARCCGSSAAMRSSRPRRWTADRQRRPHRPRRRQRAADRRRARLAARARAGRRTSSRRTRRSRAGWRSTRTARGDDLELWIDRAVRRRRLRLVVPGARRGARSASARSTRASTSRSRRVELAADVGADAVRFQGNWIPHRLRPATEDGVFFVGDSAGHCLPLTAEGIRTALYFGVACGRELRAVLDGRQDVTTALRRYRDFSAGHRLAVRLPCTAPSSPSGASTARRWTRSCACSGAAAWRAGRSGTTWTSRRRSAALPAPGRRPPVAQAAA